jgi:hypothetical protein
MVTAAQSQSIKELLVQAIAGKHPERPGDVSEEQYRACRQFLTHFAGYGRDLKGSGGQDLRESLYSLNYDLRLYWKLMNAIATHLASAYFLRALRFPMNNSFRIKNFWDAAYLPMWMPFSPYSLSKSESRSRR